MDLHPLWLECCIALVFVFLTSFAIFGGEALLARAWKHFFFEERLFVSFGIFLTILCLLGLLGGYRYEVHGTLLVFGTTAFFYQSYKFPIQKCPRPVNHNSWLVLLIFSFFPVSYFTCRFLSCLLPQQHSDPLYYHLLAPKFWAQAGRIFISELNPSLSQATFFEVIYGIPMTILPRLGLSPPRVLVISQIFGQIMHMLWGQIASCFLIFAILRRQEAMSKKDDLFSSLPLLFFISWLAIMVPSLEWTGTLAKNDYVIVAFVLAGVFSGLYGSKFLSGLFFGFAISTKVIGAWYAIGFFLAAILFQDWRKKLKLQVIPWGIGAILGSFLILAKNAYFTGNPLFPAFDSILGPGWTSLSWTHHNASFSGPPSFWFGSFDWFLDQPLMKWSEKLFFSASTFMIVFALTKKRSIRDVLFWISFLGVAALLGISMLRGGADGRYFGAFVVLIHTAGLLYRRILPVKVYLILMFIVALGVRIPFEVLVKVPREYLFTESSHYLDQFHPNYKIHLWIEENISENKRILFIDDKVQYYLDRPFETVSEMRRWEKFFESAKDLPPFQIKDSLLSLGFQWLCIRVDPTGRPIGTEGPLVQNIGKLAYSDGVLGIFELKRE